MSGKNVRHTLRADRYLPPQAEADTALATGVLGFLSGVSKDAPPQLRLQAVANRIASGCSSIAPQAVAANGGFDPRLVF